MRRLFAVASAALVLSTLPATAEPTGLPPAAAGSVASDNVELIASIPDVAAIGGRFVGDTLYVTTSTGVRIYDTATLDGVPLLLGALPLPHFENEDVDTDGETLLVSADHGVGVNVLYVIDVRDPRMPMLVGTAALHNGGHTITCIPSGGKGCAYAWIADGRTLPVFDLRDPAAPRQAGAFALPRPERDASGRPIDDTCNAGGSHDVQLDDDGLAWVSAGGGLFAYDYSNPVAPVLVHENCANRGTTGLDSDFIIHNSLHPNASQIDPGKLGDDQVDPGELVLVTEEDYTSFCDPAVEGAFQTAWLHETDGETRLDAIDHFTLGRGTVLDGRKPLGAGFCSSHYFDYRNDGIVAVGWYEQGTRFLDVSDPRNVTQVGYYLPGVTETWAAQWKAGTDLVYVFDVVRGLEVLRFNGAAGDPAVRAPHLNNVALLEADPKWGYACRRLVR